MTISGRENVRLGELWQNVQAYHARMTESGELAARRRRQAVGWMHDMLEERMMAALTGRPRVALALAETEREVAGEAAPPDLRALVVGDLP